MKKRDTLSPLPAGTDSITRLFDGMSRDRTRAPWLLREARARRRFRIFVLLQVLAIVLASLAYWIQR